MKNESNCLSKMINADTEIMTANMQGVNKSILCDGLLSLRIYPLGKTFSLN